MPNTQVTQDDVSNLQALIGGSSNTSQPSPPAQPSAPAPSGNDAENLKALLQSDQANGDSQPSAGEQFKSEAWHSAGQHLMHGELRKAAADVGSLFTSKNPAAVEAKEQLTQAGIGAAKSAGQTLATVGDAATLGHTNMRNSAVLEPSNENQRYGGYTEQMAEFALGEGVFKALSELPLTERLLQTSKVLELAKKYPAIARVLHAGVRGASVGGAVGGIHGGTEGAIQGAVAGGAGEAGAATLGELPGVVSKILNPEQVQTALQKGISDTAASASTANQVPASSKGARHVIEDVADSVWSKSKQQYAALDEATGGRIQRFTDRLENIRQKLNELTGTEEDFAKEAALLKAQKETEDAMSDAFAEAKAKGIDPKLVDEADANFKKANALYDTDHAVKMSSSGGITENKPLTVDPKKLASRLEKLHDSGRLQQALGEDGATEFLNHSYDAENELRKIVKRQERAKFLGKAALYGTGITAGGAAVRHILTSVE